MWLVGVVVVKATQEDFLGVVLVITIRVLKENKTTALRYINTIMGDFKANWDV